MMEIIVGYKLIFMFKNILHSEAFLEPQFLSDSPILDDRWFFISAPTSQPVQIPVRVEFPESWIFENVERYAIS